MDISFVRADLESFWKGLQDRCVKGLTNMLIEPANNFTFTYRRRGIPEWYFSEVMPKELEGFICDVDPAHGIRMINGSFIIGEYRKMDECTDHLDAKNLVDLTAVLREHLGPILKGLNERVD